MPLEHQDTINNDGLRQKTRTKQKKENREIKYYLSFMTVVFLACVIQVAYSALLNISKIVIYRNKIIKSEQLKHQAELTNKRLKEELSNFNSMSRVESIARNNFKMAGEDEILVIISPPKEEKPKTKKEKILYFFEKKIARRFVKNENPDDYILPQ